MISTRTRSLKADLVTEDAEPQEGSPRALLHVASAQGCEAPASRGVFPWRLRYVFCTSASAHAECSRVSEWGGYAFAPVNNRLCPFPSPSRTHVLQEPILSVS